jgi:hypothetical protein
MGKKLQSRRPRSAGEQAALKRRIRGLYRSFDRQEWDRCFAHLDPKLRDEGKVDVRQYSQSLVEFQKKYGKIDIWFIRANIYAKGPSTTRDRPFAYVYVLWQDERKELHLFRERWVKEAGRWYTRVVGLVAHQNGDGNS